MKIRKKIRGFFRTNKQKGATLVTTLILSGLVLSITLGLAKVVAKELEFSADFFFGEKAYFAAESGVETALLRLKRDPITNGNIPIKLESNTQKITTKVSLNIDNLTENVSFMLDGYRSRKLRLKKYEDKQERPVKLQDLHITVGSDDFRNNQNLFLWGIQCQKNGKTIAIQGKSPSAQREDFFSWSGDYDDEKGFTTPFYSISAFWNDLTETEKISCLLSFQNLTEQTLSIQLENMSMPPEKAMVTARGYSKNREKTIQFEYLQNNLSSFFNFGLLHSDK